MRRILTRENQHGYVRLSKVQVRYGAPEEMHEERKRTRSYSSYVALLYDIIDKEPSNYEEVAEKKEWKDAVIEDYQLIMKNDV